MNSFTELPDIEIATEDTKNSNTHTTEAPFPETTNEVPFSFDELFFSRTNEKGIILSGNSVFQGQELAAASCHSHRH